MKYKHTVFIEAEQFLPDENKIPDGVLLDGRGNARALNQAQYMIRTSDGASYVQPGDYIAEVNGEKKHFKKEDFEKVWKPV